MLQNARVTAFTVSKLLRLNQQREGIYIHTYTYTHIYPHIHTHPDYLVTANNQNHV